MAYMGEIRIGKEYQASLPPFVGNYYDDFTFTNYNDTGQEDSHLIPLTCRCCSSKINQFSNTVTLPLFSSNNREINHNHDVGIDGISVTNIPTIPNGHLYSPNSYFKPINHMTSCYYNNNVPPRSMPFTTSPLLNDGKLLLLGVTLPTAADTSADNFTYPCKTSPTSNSNEFTNAAALHDNLDNSASMNSPSNVHLDNTYTLIHPKLVNDPPYAPIQVFATTEIDVKQHINPVENEIDLVDINPETSLRENNLPSPTSSHTLLTNQWLGPEHCADEIWNPHSINDENLLKFLRSARDITSTAGVRVNHSFTILPHKNGYSKDEPPNATHLISRDGTTQHYFDILHENNYDVDRTLICLEKEPIPKMWESDWTHEDAKCFTRAIKSVGKDFYRVRTEYLSHKTTKELVQFYYFWKKSTYNTSRNNQRRQNRKNRNSGTAKSCSATRPHSPFITFPATDVVQIGSGVSVGKYSPPSLTSSELLHLDTDHKVPAVKRYSIKSQRPIEPCNSIQSALTKTSSSRIIIGPDLVSTTLLSPLPTSNLITVSSDIAIGQISIAENDDVPLVHFVKNSGKSNSSGLVILTTSSSLVDLYPPIGIESGGMSPADTLEIDALAVIEAEVDYETVSAVKNIDTIMKIIDDDINSATHNCAVTCIKMSIPLVTKTYNVKLESLDLTELPTAITLNRGFAGQRNHNSVNDLLEEEEEKPISTFVVSKVLQEEPIRHFEDLGRVTVIQNVIKTLKTSLPSALSLTTTDSVGNLCPTPISEKCGTYLVENHDLSVSTPNTSPGTETAADLNSLTIHRGSNDIPCTLSNNNSERTLESFTIHHTCKEVVSLPVTTKSSVNRKEPATYGNEEILSPIPSPVDKSLEGNAIIIQNDNVESSVIELEKDVTDDIGVLEDDVTTVTSKTYTNGRFYRIHPKDLRDGTNCARCDLAFLLNSQNFQKIAAIFEKEQREEQIRTLENVSHKNSSALLSNHYYEKRPQSQHKLNNAERMLYNDYDLVDQRYDPMPPKGSSICLREKQLSDESEFKTGPPIHEKYNQTQNPIVSSSTNNNHNINNNTFSAKHKVSTVLVNIPKPNSVCHTSFTMNQKPRQEFGASPNNGSMSVQHSRDKLIGSNANNGNNRTETLNKTNQNKSLNQHQQPGSNLNNQFQEINNNYSFYPPPFMSVPGASPYLIPPQLFNATQFPTRMMNHHPSLEDYYMAMLASQNYMNQAMYNNHGLEQGGTAAPSFHNFMDPFRMAYQPFMPMPHNLTEGFKQFSGGQVSKKNGPNTNMHFHEPKSNSPSKHDGHTSSMHLSIGNRSPSNKGFPPTMAWPFMPDNLPPFYNPFINNPTDCMDKFNEICNDANPGLKKKAKTANYPDDVALNHLNHLNHLPQQMPYLPFNTAVPYPPFFPNHPLFPDLDSFSSKLFSGTKPCTPPLGMTVTCANNSHTPPYFASYNRQRLPDNADQNQFDQFGHHLMNHPATPNYNDHPLTTKHLISSNGDNETKQYPLKRDPDRSRVKHNKPQLKRTNDNKDSNSNAKKRNSEMKHPQISENVSNFNKLATPNAAFESSNKKHTPPQYMGNVPMNPFHLQLPFPNFPFPSSSELMGNPNMLYGFDPIHFFEKATKRETALTPEEQIKKPKNMLFNVAPKSHLNLENSKPSNLKFKAHPLTSVSSHNSKSFWPQINEQQMPPFTPTTMYVDPYNPIFSPHYPLYPNTDNVATTINKPK